MFYSQLLLSKKGALGIIWMAAHCHKRLKKDQIQQTNISSSVGLFLPPSLSLVLFFGMLVRRKFSFFKYIFCFPRGNNADLFQHFLCSCKLRKCDVLAVVVAPCPKTISTILWSFSRLKCYFLFALLSWMIVFRSFSLSFFLNACLLFQWCKSSCSIGFFWLYIIHGGFAEEG